MRTEKVPLTLDEKLGHLLAELEQEHGPIEPEVMEEVRREWPAPEET